MSFESQLNSVQLSPDEWLLQPFLLAVDAPDIPQGQYLPPNVKRYFCWLQYDAPGTEKKHRTLNQATWRTAAEFTTTVHQGRRYYIPLALAVPNTKEDIRSEIRFGDGRLWGFFPRPQPVVETPKELVAFNDWFAAQKTTPSLCDLWLAAIAWERSQEKRPAFDIRNFK